jgi:hypothetical protein
MVLIAVVVRVITAMISAVLTTPLAQLNKKVTVGVYFFSALIDFEVKPYSYC